MRYLLLLHLILFVQACQLTSDSTCTNGILLGGVIGASVSCNQAQGPLFQEHPAHADKATVYFYRPYAAVLGSTGIRIFDENRLIDTLQNKGYVVLHTEQSSLSLRFSMTGISDHELSLALQPGQSHYVRVMPTASGTYSDGTNIGTTKTLQAKHLTKAQAIEEISQTRTSE